MGSTKKGGRSSGVDTKSFQPTGKVNPLRCGACKKPLVTELDKTLRFHSATCFLAHQTPSCKWRGCYVDVRKEKAEATA